MAERLGVAQSQIGQTTFDSDSTLGSRSSKSGGLLLTHLEALPRR